MNKGVFAATDPDTLTLSLWKADPDNVHSLFFWTKYPPKLTKAMMTWLSPYRVYSAITITGWEEVERRVPSMQEQIRAFDEHLALVGPEKVRWRYSPVPNDFLYNEMQQQRFDHLCAHMSRMGIREVDVALLQPSPHWSKGYMPPSAKFQNEMEARAAVLEVVVDIALTYGIKIGVCADDLILMGNLSSEMQKNAYETKCLDRAALDRAFGLETLQRDENGCRCQLSLDPCQGKQFGCASGCQYCYVSFTKVSK